MTVANKKAKPIKSSVADARPTFVGEARPKYLIPDYNVFEAALDRIRWLFDEFDGKVMVSNSGGKDSTVVVELAAKVARERGQKLHVKWLDQETEFQATVDYQRYLMYERDDIEFAWYQVPFLLENSTNQTNPWLKVWDPEHPEDWVRPKEPGSIHTNTYGQEYFYDLLSSISTADWDGAILDGIRADESPARRLTCTSAAMYKWVTWAAVDADPTKARDKSSHRFRFHPIYDWSTRDVFHAIEDNGWRYNAHYDHMFQYGIPMKNMRVSNYHHESALASLHYLQEVEPETWEAATRRLQGISTFGHLGKDQFLDALPYMFTDWEEYLHHLINNLVPHEEARETYRKQWLKLLRGCPHENREDLARVMIKSVIGGDLYGTHIGNYLVSHRSTGKGRADKGKVKKA